MCLFGSMNTPHLIEGVHVEGQIVYFAVIVGYRAVGVAVEGDKCIDKIPHFFIGSMEDMRTVLVYIDTFRLLTINISAELRTFVNNETGLTCLVGFVGKGCSEQTRANYEIIVFHYNKLSISPLKKSSSGIALPPTTNECCG